MRWQGQQHLGDAAAIGWPAKPGSMGKAYPGHRVAVIDEAGNECPDGVAGDVVERGGAAAVGERAEDVDQDAGVVAEQAAHLQRRGGRGNCHQDSSRRRASHRSQS